MEKLKQSQKVKKDNEIILKKKALDFYTAQHWLVNPNEVITCDNKGVVKINNELITTQEINNLKQEVKTLEQLRIWQIFQETIKQKAIEKAVLQSENYEQVLGGKLMIHNLGIIKSIVELIKKI